MNLKKDLRQIALKGLLGGLCMAAGTLVADGHVEHVMIAVGTCGHGQCHGFEVDPAKVQHYGPDSSTTTPLKKTDSNTSTTDSTTSSTDSKDSADKK